MLLLIQRFHAKSQDEAQSPRGAENGPNRAAERAADSPKEQKPDLAFTSSKTNVAGLHASVDIDLNIR